MIVALKPGSTVKLPTQVSPEGKVVELLFRRGSKLGFKIPGSSDGQILILDQSQIDYLYAGRDIQKLDPAKIK